MKKILGLAILVGGYYFLTKKNQPTTETTNTGTNATTPVETINEVALYEGKIIVDAGGFWTYVLNGVLRPLSQKGLEELRAKGVEIINIKTDFWTKYQEFTGTGY